MVLERTFVVTVEIPDVLPSVVADDVDDSNGVEWSREDLKPVTFTPNQSYYYYYYYFKPHKNEGGKKLRKVERGLKWKTSPGGPQRENRRAAIRR